MNIAHEIVEANGVKLTQPQKNLIAKLQNEYGFEVDMGLTSAMNIATGQVFGNLNPLVASLVTFALDAYRTYNFKGSMTVNGKPFSVQLYDRTKYLILALDSRAYYDLLD
jgi:hypothetical protein